MLPPTAANPIMPTMPTRPTAQVKSTQTESAQMETAQPGTAQLGDIQAKPSRAKAPQMEATQPGATQLGDMQAKSAQPGAVPAKSTQAKATQVETTGGNAVQAKDADLFAYLTSLDWDSCLCVRRVLKTSHYETTEEVCLIGQNGAEIGTFIRKHIADDSGLGAAYQQLFNMQQRGYRFRHLPRVYSFRRLGGESTIIMEHVAGLTLQELIEREGPSTTLTRRIFPLLCDAVSELHESSPPPLIHRDLKPSNVIVGAENLTIIDFGTTRAYHENAQRDTTIFGTRGYAPPEQFGYRQTDVRSDIYALGMVLTFCLTGQHPQPDAVTGAAEAGEAIFCPYAAVIERACAFDPDDRFRSVRELKEAFLKSSKNSGNAAAPVPVSLINPPGNLPSGLSANQPGNKLREILSRVPLGVGIAWNTLLWIVWLLFATVAICVSFFPEGDITAYSLTARLLMYAGIFVLATGGIAFALTDKRILRAKFPGSPINQSPKVALITIGLIVAGSIAFIVGALV